MSPYLILAAVVVLVASCAPVEVVGDDGAGAGVAPADSGPGQPAEVTYVFDGDTIEVEVGGRTERVRLIGIDAPEQGDCYADDARQLLRDLVGGQQVQLVTDTRDRDRYERLLRYVEVEGQHVNEVLVRRGAAHAKQYPPDTARADELAAAERDAQEAGRGLWGRC